ncbi:transposase, partial [Limnospira sp. PMC 1280.21]|uniref:IS66 family transposase n=1 Tax=Limnospira sp. PMC 1280.21 TaxID=2981063 RepID=UPI0028E0D359
GEEVTEVLEIDVPKIWVRRIVRPKYASKINSEKEGVPGVVVADQPSLPLPRCIYGATVLAYIIIGKYVDHLPFYRQRQIFKRYGYQIAESTMGESLNETCRLLEPLFETLRLKVLEQK